VFEVGFSELVLIAIVALIVLGPERLPKAARMAGTFMRKARNSFESLKQEVERELEADELKKRFAEIQAMPAAIADSLNQPLQDAQEAMQNSIGDIANATANLVPNLSEQANSQSSDVELDARPALGASEQVLQTELGLSEPTPEAKTKISGAPAEHDNDSWKPL
jgi:sec-independent protein translocase protein TatB